jgi:hypothetical protein
VLTKVLAFAAVFLLPLLGVCQRSTVASVEFGPCFSAGCRLTSYTPRDLRLEFSGPTLRLGDSTTMERPGPWSRWSAGGREVYWCRYVDRAGRACLVVAVVDPMSADNRVVVCHYGLVTVYRLRIFAA